MKNPLNKELWQNENHVNDIRAISRTSVPDDLGDLGQMVVAAAISTTSPSFWPFGMILTIWDDGNCNEYIFLLMHGGHDYDVGKRYKTYNIYKQSWLLPFWMMETPMKMVKMITMMVAAIYK